MADVEAVFRRDRALLLTGLLVVVALSWLYLADMATSTSTSAHHGMASLHAWSVGDAVLLFVMWSVMMMAMMLPSASPAILAFGATYRRLRQSGSRREPYVPTAVFVAGYLTVWFGYSLLATLLQWGLHQAALLSPAMVSTSPRLSGALLVGAGLFQWTPLKHSCLAHCRSPLGFLLNGWRDGHGGAYRMGIGHGLYCAGCCWALMVLMFVGGVMNLLWMAGLTVLLVLEKVAPGGTRTARLGGMVLVGAGGYLLLGG